MYNELHEIIKTEDFRLYGFGQGGKHHDFLKPLINLSNEGHYLASDILVLAMQYAANGTDKANAVTETIKSRIESDLNNYARTIN